MESTLIWALLSLTLLTVVSHIAMAALYLHFMRKTQVVGEPRDILERKLQLDEVNAAHQRKKEEVLMAAAQRQAQEMGQFDVHSH